MSDHESPERRALIARVDMAGRVLSTAAVMYHGTLADLGGLSPVELKAMDFLDRFGSMTAGSLAEHTGLARASVTALVERLLRKGFVHRTPHPSDGRSVVIELDRERIAADAHLYDDFVARLHAVYASFTDEQLGAIADFLERAASAQTSAAAALPRRH